MTRADDLLTTAEVAELLNIDPSAVRRALDRGDLREQRIGVQRLVVRSSLAGYKPIKRPKRRGGAR